MNVEELVRTTLERKAATVECASDAWRRIQERAERSRRWPAVGACVAGATAVAVAAVVVVMIAGPAERPDRVATGAAAESTAPATTVPTSPSLVEARLRIDGLGPVSVGMSFDEVRQVADVPFTLYDGPYCDSLQPVGVLDGVTLTDTDESPGPPRVDLIFVTRPQVATLSGIRVGSTVEEVRQAYPANLETRGDVSSGKYWLLYRATDPGQRDHGLRIDITGERVGRMVAGLGVAVDEFCA